MDAGDSSSLDRTFAQRAKVRVAVIGHIEWVEFVPVERVPAPGEIVHAGETWSEAAGGGGVAAVQLARLAGEATLFTALGNDELGARARKELSTWRVRVEAAIQPEPTRRAFTLVDEGGERTITVLGGAKLVPSGTDPRLPWAELARTDAVYFASGDAAALREARQARVLVATARELPTLLEAGVELDALVASGEDVGERYRPGELEPPPRLIVTTAGPLGGWAQPGGPFRAAEPPGRILDAYGCGDSFAAGLTFGLASKKTAEDALALAARCGAEALTRRGAHGPAESR